MLRQAPKVKNNKNLTIDAWLLISVVVLLSIGCVMLASASIPMTERIGVSSFYFVKQQCCYLGLGIMLAIVIAMVPIRYIEKVNPWILLLTIVLLGLVVSPGIARSINGSMRWLFFGKISVQPSEIAKLSLILYIAGYIVRRQQQIKTSIKGFLMPMVVLAVIAMLLLLEPDFGAVVVITTIILGMLFLAGVQLKHFLLLLPLLVCVFAFMAMSSSYRVLRLISFRDPWSVQYAGGYQLVQSLIAVGRGAIFGTGLGGSIQKLFYLPESHSDFIFAVLAEELGLIGVVFVILCYAVFVFRALEIGRLAHSVGLYYAGNVAFGIGIWVGWQSFINICVNIGLLPTKGITLPFFSAGGSSLVVLCLAVGLLFRIDHERQLVLFQTCKKTFAI